MEQTDFRHLQSAHCESGATSNLLQNAGLQLSEAMAFGIGSGIFFVHVPFLKVMGLPITSYRSFPGTIFKKTCKRLGIPYEYRRYRDPVLGARALDAHLTSGQAVGVQGNIYWLPYIPEQFRFQFNAHNFVVIGKDASSDYLISDPVLDKVSLCPARALNKSRFAKGPLSPKGLIYFPRPKGCELRLDKAVRAGIKETVFRMLYTPMPWVGIKGVRHLSRQIRKYPARLPDRDLHKLYLANVVRMQEEIGTGGAGFRFLYAAFLQEAGEKLGNSVLLESSRKMTDVGNLWREFATLSAKFCKDRLEGPYEQIPDLLFQVAGLEAAIYQNIRRRYL